MTMTIEKKTIYKLCKATPEVKSRLKGDTNWRIIQRFYAKPFFFNLGTAKKFAISLTALDTQWILSGILLYD